MLRQKRFLGGEVTSSDLSKHPADRLLNEVVVVIQESAGDLERGGDVTFLEEREGGDPERAKDGGLHARRRGFNHSCG